MSSTVDITVSEAFVKPSDKPVMGEQRLVRYFPVGLPGTKGLMLPCIWLSPYDTWDDDLKENVKLAILLLGKGPPKPDIICVRIPSTAVEKFPTGPVEW